MCAPAWSTGCRGPCNTCLSAVSFTGCSFLSNFGAHWVVSLAFFFSSLLKYASPQCNRLSCALQWGLWSWQEPIGTSPHLPSHSCPWSPHPPPAEGGKTGLLSLSSQGSLVYLLPSRNVIQGYSQGKSILLSLLLCHSTSKLCIVFISWMKQEQLCYNPFAVTSFALMWKI